MFFCVEQVLNTEEKGFMVRFLSLHQLVMFATFANSFKTKEIRNIICETLCSQPFACPKSIYSKTCVKQPFSKRQKIGFQDQLSVNAGQKYCRMLQVEHSAILLTFIKLPFVIKIFVLSILSGRCTQV